MRVLLTTFLLMNFCAAANGERNVSLSGTFESGAISSPQQTIDGFYIRTLPTQQLSAEYIDNTSPYLNAKGMADTEVVEAQELSGEIVTARSGRYFLRSEIYPWKDYRLLNGGEVLGTDRPRSMIYVRSALNKVDSDTEGWLGFSIYTPSNHQPELGTFGDRGSVVLFSMNAQPTRTFFMLSQFVPQGETESHWFLWLYTNSKSVDESLEGREFIDLGPVTRDLGKWTDFVIQYRANPFPIDTNPAAMGIPDAADKTFLGNKGIFRLWKTTSTPSGERALQLLVNRYNTPVGLVPHKTEKLLLQWRVYKYGWKKFPSSISDSIWYGFDEIRHGLAVRDGTGFNDVKPGEILAPIPLAPQNLVTN